MWKQSTQQQEIEPVIRDLPETELRRIEALRKRAANEPGGLAVTDEAALRLLATAGRGGTY